MTNKEKYMELWNETRDAKIAMDAAFASWQRPLAREDYYYEKKYFERKAEYEKIKAKRDSLVNNYYFHGDEPYVEEVAN